MSHVNDLSWEDVKNSSQEFVYVIAYGYTEGRVFSTYQPFSRPRRIKFKIDRENDVLFNRTFFLKDSEENLEYEMEGDGTIIINDPEIICDYE